MRTPFIVTSVLLVIPVASAQYIGPTPYLQASDSPLLGPSYSYFHLEDFEDGSLNTPGLTASGGSITSRGGTFTDSVDGDDGLLDGAGNNGQSLYSQNALSSFSFFFSAGSLGNFPTHAGVVWTDVGIVSGPNTGIGTVRFEAFDSGGISLGLFGPFTLGDGFATGETPEDRFFGVFHAGGLSRIDISMTDSVDWEVDHVQYGYVPSPGVLALAGALLLWRSRRKA